MNKQSKRPERFVLRLSKEEKKQLLELAEAHEVGCGALLRACIEKLHTATFAKTFKEEN